MIGFDIGGTKCAVSVGYEKDGELVITDKSVITTDLTVSPYEMVDRMCAIAEKMTDDFSLIGISCGGPLDSRRGVIMSPPNLAGWDEVKIVEYLKNRYKGEVHIQNDANACAIAEWRYGAGRGTDNMVFLTFGTGLGAGLILNGKIYAGASDMAGECGHIRLATFGPVGYGKQGSFEGFCSGGGIAELGRAMAREALQMGKTVSYCESIDKIGDISAKLIAEKAHEGNGDAIEVYKTSAEYLGKGLSILIDILNPERIVIGSVYARSEKLFTEEMNKVLKKECLPYALDVCKIVPAELSENIGDYAALSVAAMNKEM